MRKKNNLKKQVKTYSKQICDGNCFCCKYSDCLVPAIDDILVKKMTGGGVKNGYLLPAVYKKKMRLIWLK